MVNLLDTIDFSWDVKFDEDATLQKERDLPPPSLAEKKYDDMDLLEGYFVPKY